LADSFDATIGVLAMAHFLFRHVVFVIRPVAGTENVWPV